MQRSLSPGMPRSIHYFDTRTKYLQRQNGSRLRTSTIVPQAAILWLQAFPAIQIPQGRPSILESRFISKREILLNKK
jgi:hypothetical protein